MSIQADHVVEIHYTLTNDQKEVLDSSRGSTPLPYLHGHGNIVPGLERALLGKAIGDKLTVTVSASDGYGEYDARLKKELPRSAFPKDSPVEVGAMFEASGPEGDTIVIRIVELNAETVHVDGNHPLAGQALNFDVEIVSIRPATKSELEHGHAHPGDGHHH
jgi:FKBP-type peptidyl-prolyl cis-trans isomerase SlyD